jgi:hypothetical protein
MTRYRAGAAALAVVLLASTSKAQQTSFRFERPIVPAGAGAGRLPIDVALMTGGKPFTIVTKPPGGDGDARAVAVDGLSDLRLLDASGNEVPYLLVPNPEIDPVWRQAEAVLPIASIETETTKTSGFEADLATLASVDRLRLDRLPPPYLKSLRLEGSGDRSRWTMLADEATVFDLPDSRLRQVEIGFTAGSYRYLRVTWDDARSARVGLPPGISAREVSIAAPRQASTTPVVFERRASEPGRSRFHIRLPGARLPIVALDLDVAAGHVMRNVEVYETRHTGGQAAPALIGRATLRRVEQGSLAASSLRVSSEAPREPALDIVVDDGDNPPLELRGIVARFAELPWIYFESGQPAIARYGNPSLAAPRYDLEAVRQTVRIATIPDASWGEARPLTPAENDTGPPGPVPTGGAAIDARGFRFVRELPPGDAGLIAVRVDEAALAHSRIVGTRFEDLRVIDSQGRQVPYLVERSPEPLSVDASLERLSSAPASLASPSSETVYRIRWPYDRLPSARLVLRTMARVFQRRISLAVERAPDRNRRDPWIDILATATWMHAAQETPAPALTLEVPELETRELLVLVAEGDNSVLPISAARLLFPQYRIRLFREPQAVLQLAYGRADLTAPNYDLALLAPRLLGISATDVTPAPEGTPAAAPAPPVIPLPWSWALLGGAVIVLLVLIARLIRSPQPNAP